MKYLRKFNQDSDYQDFLNSKTMKTPNVSYVTEIPMVYYNPLEVVENSYSYLLEVTSDNVTAPLFNSDVVSLSQIEEMSVNGEVIEPVSAMTFASAGEYLIKIKFKENLTDTNNLFNVFDVESEDTSIKEISMDNFNTTEITNMHAMFSKTSASNLDLSGWDTSKVTDMSYMFSNCNTLEQVKTGEDVSTYSLRRSPSTSIGWDTSNVGDMSWMFYSCKLLTSIDGISNWDVNNVTNMSYMFYNCLNVPSLELSKWDVSKVTNMSEMFNSCEKLTSLDLANWDTSKVTTMYQMFDWCINLKEIRMGGDVSNVTDATRMFDNIKTTGTFYYNTVHDYSKIIAELPSKWTAKPLYENITCTELSIVGEEVLGRETSAAITFTATIEVTNVIDGSVTSFIKTGTGISHEFTQNPSETDREIEISFTYYGMTATTTIIQKGLVKAFADFRYNVYSVSTQILGDEYINYSFYPKDNIAEMRINGVEITPVSNYAFSSTDANIVQMTLKDNVTDLSSMFKECTDLVSISNINNWDVSKVTSMRSMFEDCSDLISIDLSGWDTSRVTNIWDMFYNCSSLREIKMGGDMSKATLNNTFMNVASTGTFYYNPVYDYSKIIAKLPSGWNTVRMAENITCTELSIVGEDAPGLATTTTVTYTATLTGTSTIDGSVITWNESGVGISNAFEQNTSETDSRQIEVSFTYFGKTATTTIRQGMYSEGVITCKYYAMDTKWKTDLLSSWSSVDIDSMLAMYVDGVQITPTLSYIFSTTGDHTVHIKFKDDINITNLKRMFYSCSRLTSVDLSILDISKVTNMYAMFNGCSMLKEIKGISDWNVSQVTDMGYLFERVGLTSLDLSKWDVSKVTNMENIFHSCDSLNYLSLPKDIRLNHYSMFYGCYSLYEVIYNGTMNEFNSLDKFDKWYDGTSIERVICTDGVIEISKVKSISFINVINSNYNLKINQNELITFELYDDTYKSVITDAIYTEYPPKDATSTYYYYAYDSSMINVINDSKTTYGFYVEALNTGTTELYIYAGPGMKGETLSYRIEINISE